VPSSSLQSSLYQVVSLPGQSFAVDLNPPSCSWTLFILHPNVRHSLNSILSHHNHGTLYYQQIFAFTFTLRTLYSLNDPLVALPSKGNEVYPLRDSFIIQYL
jgi:hypothetical protein